MKKKRYTVEKIIDTLKEHESDVKADVICSRLGIATGTFYNWRSKYGGGLKVSEAKRLKELELENAQLKKLLAEKVLETEAMRDVLSTKW